MFDIGFTELLLIAIVALVVLGPERLPRVARTAGHLIGRFQRYANQVKSDISREMQVEDLKKMRAEMEQAAASLKDSVTREASAIEGSLQEAGNAAKAEVEDVASVVDAGRLQAAADAAENSVAQMEQALADMLAEGPPGRASVAEAAGEPATPDTPDTPAMPDPQLALSFDNLSPVDQPVEPAPRSAA